MKKRLMAAILCLCMVVSILPQITIPALAADDLVSVGLVSDSTLASLGFNVSTDKLEEYIADVNNRPSGEVPVSLYTINELAIGNGTGMDIYNNPAADKGGPIAIPVSGTGTAISLSALGRSPATGAFNFLGQQMRSVELDLNGTGKAEFIAQILAFRTTNSSKPKERTKFVLRLIDAASGVFLAEKVLGEIPFQLPDVNLSALLSITAGDFDNDGKDEIAVFDPAGSPTSVLSGLPEVAIYKYSGGNLTSSSYKTIASLSGMNFGGVNSEKADGREYPSVSIAAVRQYGECDDLAVAVSYARHVDHRGQGTKITTKNNAAKLCVWQNPLGTEKIETFSLSSSWTGYNRPSGDYEIMMFPGVDAGDINEDGIAEIVVAGYRVKNTTMSSTNWDLDEDRWLVNYYSYNPASSSYSNDSRPMQWIGLKGAHYSGAIKSEPHFDYNAGRFSAQNYLHAPPAVEIFAERGLGVFNSVFVGGFIMALPNENAGSAEAVTKEYNMGMYGGYDTNVAPSGNMVAMVPAGETFRIRYAAPLGQVDVDKNIIDHHGYRAVLEATSGNFNENNTGKEQLVFTYLIQDRTSINDRKGTTVVCALSHAEGGDDNNRNTGENTISGVAFNYRRDSSKKTPILCVTVAAPDTDDDSLIMRLKTEKTPEYYFSDPQILAVLQAAPYFKGLEYDASPETSISKTAGSGITDSHAISITGEVSVGIHAEGGPAFLASMSLLELEILGKISGSIGKGVDHEKTSTMSTSFSATSEDSVALTMIPYVRYHYDQWDPTSKKWVEVPYNVPMTPQKTQLSVDIYDRIAKEQGWTTLRDNVLNNSVPGHPETYSMEIPDDSYANSGNKFDFKDGELVKLGEYNSFQPFLSTGQGAGYISSAISMNESYEHIISWGAGAGLEVSGRITIVQGGIDVSVDYTGSHGTVSFNEIEFSGSVPNIPEDMIEDYAFDWELGTWFKPIENVGQALANCMVVGYRVKNIRTRPLPPDDLAVEQVTNNSVTLSWSDTPSSQTQYHSLFRVVNGFYYHIKTIEANDRGEYLFTDAGRLPGTKYEYAVATIAYSGSELKTSGYSDIVPATTNTIPAVFSLSHPEDISVRNGQPASFEVGYSSLPPNAGNPSYQWQVNTGGNWRTIQAPNNKVLALSSVAENMNGNRYRCVVIIEIGGQPQMYYSKYATLTVGKGGTTTTLEIEGDKISGKADSHVMKTIQPDGTPVDVSLVAVKDGERFYVIKNSVNDYYLMSIDDWTYYSGTGLDTLVETAISANIAEIDLDSITLNQILVETGFYDDESNTDGFKFSADILDADQVITDAVFPGSLPSGMVLEDTSYITYSEDGNTVYEVYASITEDETTEYFTLYYTDDVSAGYEQIFLHSVYKAEGNPIDNFDPTDFEAVHVEVVPTEATTVLELEKGDEITLTAWSKENAVNNALTPTGRVIFVITNENTGAVTKLTETIAAGSATTKWTPKDPGIYTIVAQYTGNSQLLASTSGAKTYTAYAGEGWLGLNSATSMVYGESIIFEPIFYTVWSSIVSPGSVTVDYEVKDSSGAVITSEVMSSNDFTPNAPGVFTVTATYIDGATYRVTKAVTVEKKAITVRALDQMVEVDELSGQAALITVVREETLEIDGLVKPGDSDGVFGLQIVLPKDASSITALSVGSYPIITTSDKTSDAYKAFAAKYLFVAENATLTITAPRYDIRFSAGPNGNISARVRDSGATLSNGNRVYSGSELVFDAIPETGFTVNKWSGTVGNSEITSVNDSSYQLSAIDDVNISVTFSPKDFRLQYSSSSSGVLRAYYDNIAGSPIGNNSLVAAQNTIYFNAVPEDGYYIESWSVNGEIQKNPDGSNVTGNSFIIDRLDEDTNVTAVFSATEQYTVTVSAIMRNGMLLPETLGTVSDDAVRTEDMIPSGSSFTVTAVPVQGSGYQIMEWRRYSSDGSYVEIQGNRPDYTVNNLQDNLDIRVVFTTASTYTLNFKVDDTANQGTITAQCVDTTLQNGNSYPAYIPVTLTASPDTDYLVDKWEINGITIYAADITDDEDSTDSVYSIPKLVEDTEVVVYFKEAPEVVEPVNPGGTGVGKEDTKKPEDPKDPEDPEITPWDNPFVDVRESDWFYDDVEFVHKNGLVQGTSGNTFSPGMPTTRGMIVTILGRLYGVDIDNEGDCEFDDVDNAMYYAPYIAWAARSGIVEGVGSNRFEPNREIARQEMAAILWRYAKFIGMDVSLDGGVNYLSFNDVDDIHSYALEPMAWNSCHGIMNGKPGELLDPLGLATRAEVAAMLHRFAEYIETVEAEAEASLGV